jgi:hypothetical protein
MQGGEGSVSAMLEISAHRSSGYKARAAVNTVSKVADITSSWAGDT